MKITLEQLRSLAQSTINTRPAEIDCDQWLERVAAYLEAARIDGPMPEELAEVGRHIDVCPACREELEAMLASMPDESSM